MKHTPIELPPSEIFPPSLIKKVHDWLGEDGINFFSDVKEKHGTILAVWDEGGLPHPVHFREGMQVRNYLRMQPECEGWNDHRLDDQWAHIIERAIEYQQEDSWIVKLKHAASQIFSNRY